MQTPKTSFSQLCRQNTRVIASIAGFMFATFISVNLRAHIVNVGERWFLIMTGIFLLQLGLAVLLKLYFFTITV